MASSRGSIKAGLAQIKAAVEADKAFKAGEEGRAVEALASYRQALELLDPSGDAIAALSPEDQQKLSEKRAQAQKRISKLEKLSATVTSAADGAPPPGEYKLVVDCRVFVGPEPGDAEKDYSLDDGEVFELLESKLDADGAVKVRSADGWISYLDGSGQPVLVDVSVAAVERSSDPSATGGDGEWGPVAPLEAPGSAVPITRMPSVMFASSDSDAAEAGNEDDPDDSFDNNPGKLAPKRRGSQWIDFKEDEPIDDPTSVLAGLGTPTPRSSPADGAAAKRRGSVAIPAGGAAAKRRGSVAIFGRGLGGGPEEAIQEPDQQAPQPRAQPEPEPEPEPELPPRQLQQSQLEPPLPSPAVQPTESQQPRAVQATGWQEQEHEQGPGQDQVGHHPDQEAWATDEELWAARARTLGRSASSQLDILERLTVRPRTLPPRPTLLDGATQEETIASLREQLEQAKGNAAAPPMLRSQTQRVGLQKRRQLRHGKPQPIRSSSIRSSAYGQGFEDDDEEEDAVDIAALEEWLAPLHLGHLAMALHEVLGVATVDDLLDLVPADVEELSLKPVQSRRLLRAIEAIDVDDSGEIAAATYGSTYAETVADRRASGIAYQRMPYAPSAVADGSMAAAADALRHAQAARAERRGQRDANGATASTAWGQSTLQATSPPMRMGTAGYVDPVAVAWADSIMGGANGPAAGRGPTECEIGVVSRLFCEVKPLLVRRAMRQDGVEGQYRGGGGGSGSGVSAAYPPPTLPQGLKKPHPHSYREQYSSYSSNHQGGNEHPVDDTNDPLRLSPAPAPAPGPWSSPSPTGNSAGGVLATRTGSSLPKASVFKELVVGPGIYSRTGVDDDVLAALNMSTRTKHRSPSPASPSPSPARTATAAAAAAAAAVAAAAASVATSPSSIAGSSSSFRSPNRSHHDRWAEYETLGHDRGDGSPDGAAAYGYGYGYGSLTSSVRSSPSSGGSSRSASPVMSSPAKPAAAAAAAPPLAAAVGMSTSTAGALERLLNSAH
jgi:hypothetical protein